MLIFHDNRNRKSGRDPPIGTKRTAIGSNEKVSVAYYDAGLLSTVLDAYNEHFILRTGKLRPFKLNNINHIKY